MVSFLPSQYCQIFANPEKFPTGIVPLFLKLEVFIFVNSEGLHFCQLGRVPNDGEEVPKFYERDRNGTKTTCKLRVQSHYHRRRKWNIDEWPKNEMQKETKLEEFRSFRTSKRRKKRRKQRSDEEKV